MNLKYSVCVAYEDNLFYYLFERDTGKEREAERQVLHLMVYSADVHNNLG